MFVIIVGSPFEGMKIYGPFHTAAKASEYAEKELWREASWWIERIYTPPW
jgi:hypothetical protein